MVADPVARPRSWISEGRFHDIDAQAAQYHGYGQRYQQLSSGPFEGRFCSFHFGDDLVVNLESANRELAASAATPPGRYGVCFLAESSPPCALNASSFELDHVLLSPENKSVEGTMAEGVNIYCMDISSTLFADDGGEIRRAAVLSDPARSRQLRELVHSGISTFTSLESPADYPAAVCGFKAAIADLLWRMAASGAADDGVSARLYSAARTLQVFRRARDYIHHHLGDGISIPILCKQTGVSRRSLECVFRSVVGIGPGNYVRLLQLNLIRRDLLSGASDDVSIGVVAARHGVWHWSRFSRYYRSLFGELPSQTRQRRVGCANNSAMGFAASGTARV